MIHDPPRADAATRPLILVVDDMPANRFIVQRRLVRMNYQCLAAEGGQEALDLLRTTRPALVLLDFMMPDLCGLAVLHRIRAMPAFATLPVIMLTARTDAEAVVSSMNAGADDYVLKPIDFTVLQTRIEAQLQRGEQTRERIEDDSRLDRPAAAHAVDPVQMRDMLQRAMARARALERQLDDDGPARRLTWKQIHAALLRIAELCERAGQVEQPVAAACLDEIRQIALVATRKIEGSIQPAI